MKKIQINWAADAPGSAPASPPSEIAPTPSAPAAPPAAETPAPAPEAPATPAPAPAPAPAAEKPSDWRDRRIARLTAQLREEQQKGKNAPAQPAAAAKPLDPTADFNKRVADAAAAQVAATRFNEKSNAAASAGRQKYGKDEFNSSIRSLVSQFVPDDNDREALGRYNAFISAALATGHAEDVIYELGRNLDDAEAVMELDPLELTAELTRRFAAPAAAGAVRNEISAAPKPIRPITPGNETVLDPANPDQAGKLSTAEWMARRNEQVAKRSAR
jgi:hypothetical protein